jgi:hypothetical protein
MKGKKTIREGRGGEGKEGRKGGGEGKGREKGKVKGLWPPKFGTLSSPLPLGQRPI